jgi:hypothetical protein
LIATTFGLLFSLVLSEPRIDAQCLSSPFRLATDNVPVGSGVPTSVVNIWGLQNAADGTTAGWLYKNGLGNYYLQLNYKAKPERYDGIPLSSLLLAKPQNGLYKPLVKVSPTELIDIENALLSHGVSRSACFSGDLAMPKQ